MLSEYHLLQNTDIRSFLKQANEYLERGFEPLGGISVTTVNTDSNNNIAKDGENMRIAYVQAFVR